MVITFGHPPGMIDFRQQSYIFSAILHISLALLAYFGLPRLIDKDILREQSVITVEILPISELTNVKTHRRVIKEPPKEKPKEVTAPTPPKPALPEPVKRMELTKPEVKASAPKPPQVKTQPVEKIPLPLPPKEKKEEPPKPPEAKKQEQVPEDAFAAVLKSVEQMEETLPEEAKQDKTLAEVEDYLENAVSEKAYTPYLPMTLSEKDAIRQQVMRNWTVLGGARDIQNMVVTLKIHLTPKGEVNRVEIVDSRRYNNDSFFRALTDSAIRAVYKSSPLEGLPAAKYDTPDGWRELELHFDPREMVW